MFRIILTVLGGLDNGYYYAFSDPASRWRWLVRSWALVLIDKSSNGGMISR
jgi:hypothetical protein